MVAQPKKVIDAPIAEARADAYNLAQELNKALEENKKLKEDNYRLAEIVAQHCTGK